MIITLFDHYQHHILILLKQDIYMYNDINMITSIYIILILYMQFKFHLYYYILFIYDINNQDSWRDYLIFIVYEYIYIFNTKIMNLWLTKILNLYITK